MSGSSYPYYMTDRDVSFELAPLKRELKRLSDEVERLKRPLLPDPVSDGCTHTFPLWMVIPPGGCWVNCPICHGARWVAGNSSTC